MKVHWKISFLLTIAMMVGMVLAGFLDRFFPPPVECYPAVIILAPDSPEPLIVEVGICATHFRVVFPE
jgi:hypothetical protein